ncbi:hypothetical protein TP70_00110 [Staphylococcus microti]|uniref:Uncharacterized protein n=2 Tax=Staphylococcus microti TaxID=569857 RepID=A0A0D6XSU4_9STAP|nr:hypothetical protein [Staphylococcus microti]KIX91869.1 hypothetical protein TP70_00110 [Staphylococcus microti]PNZ84030.1 hypothetical protein CD132_01280 [Staphylococcus microti]SUM56500.1 Uncharacterised protein [Staphylococcus microti]
MDKQKQPMPKSQQVLLAIIIVMLVLEVILTAFFISFSSPIFKGLTMIHGLLMMVFIVRQVKRKGL